MKTEEKIKIIKEALESAVVDWGSNFDIEVSFNNDDDYGDATIVYQFYYDAPLEFNFMVMVEDGEAMMEYGEDSWYEIDQQNLFTWMFFEMAQREARRIQN